VVRISGDKPPVFIIADRGTGQRYVIPTKAADESTVRLLLADRRQESITIYIDGFRAYEPLEDNDAFDREYVVHGDGEYSDGDVHVNTCESQDRAIDPGSRLIEASPKTSSRRISERSNFAVMFIETRERSAENHPRNCALIHQQSTPHERYNILAVGSGISRLNTCADCAPYGHQSSVCEVHRGSRSPTLKEQTVSTVIEWGREDAIEVMPCTYRESI
jgi:transposase-like protein